METTPAGGTHGKAIGGTYAKAIGGTYSKAIGGTYAKAIGGTHEKAIGGTYAKAIGGTHEKAIGGTYAKAIGGTHEKAIGGTYAKAIGGTHEKAIGGTYTKATGGARLLSTDSDTPTVETGSTMISLGSASVADSNSPLAKASFESTPGVSFMGGRYDWILVGPVTDVSGGHASVMGYRFNVDDSDGVAAAAESGKMVAVAARPEGKSAAVFVTDEDFVAGSTEVVVSGKVERVDSSVAKLVLTNGVKVDFSDLSNASEMPSIQIGDLIYVQGHLY